jgi:amino acid adenylation domain-containing protein
LPGPEKRLLLHDYLRDTARSAASCTAIVEEGRITSFGQLLGKATCLAAALVQRGLRKRDRVALVLSKTTEAIIALFSTLMAGAVYVPIPPRWPAKRIHAALEDCAPRFVITEPTGGLGDQSACQTGRTDSLPLIVDRHNGTRVPFPEALEGSGSEFPEPALEPDDPAFILFTSGSTGQPKGVVISHRAAGAFVNWSAEEFQICRADRLACPSPLSFDLSTFDIFNMALCGATCVIVPDRVVWMPRFLTRFVNEQGITVWYSVPSILAGMLNEPEFVGGGYPDLRLILFAGEVFPSHQVARLQATVPHAACYNLYGPTESNVVAYHHVRQDFDSSRPIPIGKACPYAELMLDPAGMEFQNGFWIGELLARGKSLMTGYWNRPTETEMVFTNVCGREGPPRRFYRTGDRVSLDSSGNYTFVGRLDRQVKRRGFRIELGEIEATLGRHADVLEVVVVSSQDHGLETTITAFVRRRPDSSISPGEMKAHCAQSIPSYAVPDHIVFVEEIPRGSRGKIDYATLRELHARRRENGDQSGGASVHS